MLGLTAVLLSKYQNWPGKKPKAKSHPKPWRIVSLLCSSVARTGGCRYMIKSFNILIMIYNIVSFVQDILIHDTSQQGVRTTPLQYCQTVPHFTAIKQWASLPCCSTLHYPIFQEPELRQSAGGQGVFHSIIRVCSVMRELPWSLQPSVEKAN